MFAAGDQLMPEQHAESLSAAELAGADSASEEGSSEPDTSYDKTGNQSGARPEMQDSRGKKRRRRDIGEGGLGQEAPKHAMLQTGLLILCPVRYLTGLVLPSRAAEAMRADILLGSLMCSRRPIPDHLTYRVEAKQMVGEPSVDV